MESVHYCCVIIFETGKVGKFYLQPPIANLVKKISSAVFELLTLVQKDGRTDSGILIGAVQDGKMIKDNK